MPGVGAAQAARLLAAVELGRRTLLQPPADRPQLRSPRETAAYLLPRFSARPVEHFGLVLLDVRCRVIRTALLSVGTDRRHDGASARGVPRGHGRPVRRAWFCSIITPRATRPRAPTTCASPRASCAPGEVMGIDVIDHLILADHRYYSFRESGGLAALDP